MKLRLLVLLFVVMLAWGGHAGEMGGVTIDTNLVREGRLAVMRGMAWLESLQATNGCIGAPEYPAITALALRALKDGGSTNVVVLASIEKYVGHFVAGNPVGWMSGYNKTICQDVLAGDSKLSTHDARLAWIAKRKQLDREYDVKARQFELRQLEWQQQRSKLITQGADADLERASRIAKSVQGGAVMVPELSPPTGTVVAATIHARKRRGYGNLSYEGRMSLIHDEVTNNDPRVDAYLDWAERSWSLDTNPGAGLRGLYYFYQSLAKCLAVSGEEVIYPLAGGSSIKWREELIRKLVVLQRTDETKRTSYWVNESGVWMEDNPVLVTAYALLALERALPPINSTGRLIIVKHESND